MRMSIICFKFWKEDVQSALAVVNLNFLHRIHKLFSIESHSIPNFRAAFGTDDSPRTCGIKCKGDVTICQN
jgi:hypothetical protein